MTKPTARRTRWSPALSRTIAAAAGAELRRLRVCAGLSHSEVARLIESHRPIVGRIERGVHVPDVETCALHAAVCGGSLLNVLRAVDRALGWSKPRVSARAGRPLRRAA